MVDYSNPGADQELKVEPLGPPVGQERASLPAGDGPHPRDAGVETPASLREALDQYQARRARSSTLPGPSGTGSTVTSRVPFSTPGSVPAADLTTRTQEPIRSPRLSHLGLPSARSVQACPLVTVRILSTPAWMAQHNRHTARERTPSTALASAAARAAQHCPDFPGLAAR